MLFRMITAVSSILLSLAMNSSSVENEFYYGNPAGGCKTGEQVYNGAPTEPGYPGVKGHVCGFKNMVPVFMNCCGVTQQCADKPACNLFQCRGLEHSPQTLTSIECVIPSWEDPSHPTLCGLVCDYNDPTQCDIANGAKCNRVFTYTYGICTYPPFDS